MRSLLAAALCAAVLLASCAPRTAPVVAGAPKHPEFVFPIAPAGTLPAQAARLDRGWQYLQADDHRNAEREFTAALKQQPSFYPADAAMGYLLLARGNEKEAVTAFDRVLQTDAVYVPALIGRGQTFLAMERDADALASFEAALANDPSLVELKGRVDVLRFRATQAMLQRAKTAADAQRWDEAQTAYQRAIDASPDSAFLYRELAAVELKAGQSAGALVHYRKAVELDPSDARSWAAIGGILETQGEVNDSLSAYERARTIDESEVPDAVLNRIRAKAALLKLPAEYRAIPSNAGTTKGDVAALIGIRLASLVARASPRQVIITDIRSHWAQQWITAVVRAGIMETPPNYEFEPNRQMRRGDLAVVASRLLSLIGVIKPELARRLAATKVAIADVDVAHLLYPAVSAAVASGVMPLASGNFELLRGVSGAEAIEIVSRLEALARP